MRKRSFITFIIVLVFLGSCSHRSREITVITPDGSDSVYYARGFKVNYFSDYTRVDIRDPWDTLKTRQTYILIDRNEAQPKDLPQGVVIKVPVERAAIYTSVHTSIAEQLGVLDRVAGVCETQYITSEGVLAAVKEGKIEDLGLSASPNVEKMIDLKCEIIIASPFENSGYGVAEKLGIPIVEAADYMENTLLGRTEWVRLYGLLFGKREQADSLFLEVVKSYDDLKSLASSAKIRPTVMLERKYGASWIVPAGDSYIGALHSDAGANYIFDEYKGNVALLSFETVLDKAIDADFWLLKYSSNSEMTYKDLEEEYPPYTNFSPFKNRQIYICNTVLTPYYDDITLHPDLILKDLIYIYHPELLPDHQLKYYKKMQ